MSRKQTPSSDCTDSAEAGANRGSYEISIGQEELLGLAADFPRFVQKVVGGKRIHKSTAYRWVLQGVRGHRLPSVRVGGRLYTSDKAFSWWARELAHELVEAQIGLGDDQSASGNQVDVASVLLRAGIRD